MQHPADRMLDLGRLGVADRDQDIALALRHLKGDFGPAWRSPFARAYGIANIDGSKLAFFFGPRSMRDGRVASIHVRVSRRAGLVGSTAASLRAAGSGKPRR